METNSILTQKSTKLSSTERTAHPKKILRPGKPGGVLPDAKVSRFPVETGGDAERTEKITGEPRAQCQKLSGTGSPPFTKPTEVYTETQASSIQTHALAGTLEAVRGLRDEYFQHNPNSRPSLLLAQMTFILQRIDHGIPSGREAFLAILRAARLPEPTPEAAEVT